LKISIEFVKILGLVVNTFLMYYKRKFGSLSKYKAEKWSANEYLDAMVIGPALRGKMAYV
jgi:hypothetical protein